MLNFCDFCDCEGCRSGLGWGFKITHAPTECGKWICDVCFTYDVCKKGTNPVPGGCDGVECEHRPRLSGPWQERKEETNDGQDSELR